MCGLAGFARNPKSNDLQFTRLAFEELLAKAESRGKHAVGLSVHDTTGKGFIWKIAMPATTAMKMPVWKEQMDRIDQQRTAIVLGHTRHATQNNAKKDDCAHPFRYGAVTGAHNGMIYNWRELETQFRSQGTGKYQVDSEIIFDLLNRTKKPQKALEVLDGYWALTWQRDGYLFMCKTNDAQLAAAYSPAMETLFWHSRRDVLETVMKSMGTKYEIWELQPDTLYRFDPTEFAVGGTNVKKQKLTFTARRGKRFNTQATGELNGMGVPRGGYSTTRSLPATTGGDRQYDLGVQDAKTDPRRGDRRRTVWTMEEMDVEIQTLRSAVMQLRGDLQAQAEELQALRELVGCEPGIEFVGSSTGDDKPPF